MSENTSKSPRVVGSSNRSRLSIAIGIVSAALLVEICGAFLTGSLSLLADAGHLVSDLLGLVIALLASIVALRPASDRHTFGFQRAEVLAALVNGLILVVVAVFVASEAVSRLISPNAHDVQGIPMMAVAAIGLLANISALVVLHGGDRKSLNVRGAYLEILGDTFGSIAVVVAAVVIVTTGFESADAIASLLIAFMIVPRAIMLLRDVVGVLMQSTSSDTDIQEVRAHILATAGVIDVHDIHVWAITSGKLVFSAHIVVESKTFTEGATDRLLDQLAECLSDHFDVEHSTFQLEPVEHADHEQDQHR